MSNTSTLYSAMKRYIDTMLAARAEYEKTMAMYKSAKGSAYYDEMAEKANRKRMEATASIKADTAAQVSGAINAMLEKANTLKPTPLTPDQMAILQAIKMRDRVTTEELIQAGNAMMGNLSGLAIIDEVAKKNGVLHSFIGDAKGMNGETLTKAIREMARRCYAVIDADGSTKAAFLGANPRAAEIAKQRHESRYGAIQTAITLPNVTKYTDEADFLSSMMLTGVNVAEFTEAVN